MLIALMLMHQPAGTQDKLLAGKVDRIRVPLPPSSSPPPTGLPPIPSVLPVRVRHLQDPSLWAGEREAVAACRQSVANETFLNLSLAVEKHSNLGGMGPEFGSAASLRFANVGADEQPTRNL